MGALDERQHVMQPTLAYLNGRFVPFADAGLPLHDAGFVTGATVVDNARTFRHKLFRWSDHLAHFRRDCAACFITLEASDEQLTALAGELVASNAKSLSPGGELQLVTFATPGPLGFYLGESTNGPPTLGMATYPVPFGRFRRYFTEGVTLAIAGVQYSNLADVLPPCVKHRSRMAWHIAEKSVNAPGAAPVILNQHGTGDTAIGTILAVVGETVIRPLPGTVLESISSRVVGELCDTIGLRVEDAQLDLRSLSCRPEALEEKGISERVSELLLVGTGFCIAGVRKLTFENRDRDFNWPGPVFRKLLEAWSALVGLDIEKQFTMSPDLPS